MRGAFLAASAAMAMAGSALWAQDGPAPAERWAAIAACAESETAAARHACMDQVLREAGLLDSARELAQQRASFGEREAARTQAVPPAPPAAPPRPAPAPPQPAAAPAAQSIAAPAPAALPAPSAVGSPPPPAPAPPPPLETLVTTIADAGHVGNRRLLIITAEGAVWRQTDGEAIRILPRAGSAFEVSRAALGGYRCRIGRSTLYRCQRVGESE